MALWTPDTSIFAEMKEIVASPGMPPGTVGGMKNLTTESGFFSEKGRRLWTIEG